MENIVWTEEKKEDSLSNWYTHVRKKAISELTVEDICRFVRQNLYVSYILPYALEALQKDPTAGELYNGELLRAVSKVSNEFWVTHKELSENCCKIIIEAKQELNSHVIITEEILKRLNMD
ncbi:MULTISPECIES: contact-dependent growth inhibition system immunity protein [Saccharibacillus]|uniref:contact-dependent growth inhibition system immunity protein n=1 Tax=Saccharibacillus TaxID=456492 RepID=UPI00123B1E40|nr:contact-dependent growth inhibition system immunity protein [Saccharibacillus sp. WB 17]MWJ31912.1 hypothetical protein [Saccharibacillus sp. WB 17]